MIKQNDMLGLKFVATVFLFSFFIASCSEKAPAKVELVSAKLSGQIFVIQKNRQNVELGGVDVYLLSKSYLENLVKRESRKYSIYAEAVDLSDYFKNVTKRLESYSVSLGGDEIDSQLIRNIEFSRGLDDKYSEKALMLKWSSGNSRSKLETTEKYTYRSWSNLNRWIVNSMIYSSHTGEGVLSTQTDSNGRFDFKVPEGEYYICAQSSRAVINDKEFYLWFERIGSNTDKVFLNNNNEGLSADLTAFTSEQNQYVKKHSINEEDNKKMLDNLLDEYQKYNRDLKKIKQKNAIKLELSDQLREIEKELKTLEK